MSAASHFRRLTGVAFITTLAFGTALLSPVLAGRLITGEPFTGQDDLLVCLFVPTFADWPSHILSYLISGLLSLVVLSGLLSFLRQFFRTRRTLRMLLRLAQPASNVLRAGPLTTEELMVLSGRIDFVKTDTPLAFCYGWLRPRICLSTGAVARLDRIELEALLLHEYHHLLKGDPLRTTVAHVLASSFFFVPVIRDLQGQFLLAKEIEADEYALRIQGSERPLLGALYKLLLSQGARSKTGSLAIAGAVDCINQRLDYLLDKRMPSGTPLLAIIISSSVITGITVLMAFTSWAATASVLWQQAHSSLGGC